MLKMVDGTGIIGVDMVCPLGATVSPPQPPNYDNVEMEGVGSLMLPNSLKAPLERLELGGKTAQATNTGKNLFDLEKAKKADSYESVRVGGVEYKAIVYNVSPNTDYTLSVALKKSGAISNLNIANTTSRFSLITSGIKSRTVNSLDSGLVYVFFSEGALESNIEVFDKQYFDIQLEIGKVRTTYEPYTGGQPSPNPEYTQEIKSVGKHNEDSGKYEVDLRVLKKNLLPNISSYWKLNTSTSWGAGSKYDPINLISSKNQALVFINIKPNTKYSFLNLNKKDIWVYRLIERDSKDLGLVNHGLYGNETLNKETYSFTTHKETKSIIFQIKKIDNTECTSEDIEKIPVMFYEGDDHTSYEPYTEQTLTLTSDRPLTKWDKLIEQGGQYGWLYQSRIEEYYGDTLLSLYSSGFNFLLNNKKISKGEGYCSQLLQFTSKENVPCIHFNMAPNQHAYTLNTQGEYGSSVSEIKEYLKSHPLHLVYQTENTEFIPLPEEEQNAIRNLRTYYPTTVITVDGGELDPDIKVTYRKEK